MAYGLDATLYKADEIMMFGEDGEQVVKRRGALYDVVQRELGIFASPCFWCGGFWLSAMLRSDDASRCFSASAIGDDVARCD